MATALLSALTHTPVRADLASDGRNYAAGAGVLPIGGLKEKTLAAKTAGIKTVLVPEKNRPDVEEIPAEIKNGLEILFVETMDDVIAHAFVGGKGTTDMVIKSVQLETVCGITSKLPDNILPEIAFAGKSNVGKSSLINGIMNRKSLARTSSQPGKTQTINFYNVNEVFYLVDLPGYGYAKANQEVKAQWGKMIERYLHSSKQLKAVFC